MKVEEPDFMRLAFAPGEEGLWAYLAEPDGGSGAGEASEIIGQGWHHQTGAAARGD